MELGRGLWERLGLGSSPLTPSEARPFVQRRVAMYLGGLCLMWLSITVTGFVSTALFMPELVASRAAPRVAIIHHAGTLALFFGWLFCRRGERSLRALAGLEAGTTVAQAIVISSLMSSVDVRFRPDLSMTLGVSCALIGRAAVVPSDGVRTLVLGALSSVPILVATYATHLDLQASPITLSAGLVTAQVAMWLVFAVLLSTTISRVIYGLSRRIQEAAILGQYTLEKKIGQGGMGVVYLARHALLRRPTAIKLLAPGRTSLDALARFEREVQTMSLLRHPNTVAVYDYGRTPDGVFYYAMEYLDGIDLECLIRHEAPIPEGRAVHIVVQIARALHEAHLAGLIHRDIKPSNIILCKYGEQADFAKVVDFGLVKELRSSEATTTATLAGTPLYMSPESITDPASVDARSDIYALGGVAYALLTGHPPFSGETVVQVCFHHLHTQVPSISERRGQPLTPALEECILSCLAKDRDRRPSSAAALAEQLEGCNVARWTAADALGWWTARGASLQGRLAAPQPESPVAQQSVAVDLSRRDLPTHQLGGL